uniref:Zinc carboxypeptidase A 1 n=1 Tax=Steinernema glaseri TaxID=37863 RepID=A0A1I7Y8M5_9BILA
MRIIVLVLLIGYLRGCNAKDFEGHKVLSVKTSSDEHLKALSEIRSIKGLGTLDFWTEPRRNKGIVDIRVTPEQEDRLYGFLKDHGMEHTVKIQNLQK